jgi:hypothetical protein
MSDGGVMKSRVSGMLAVMAVVVCFVVSGCGDTKYSSACTNDNGGSVYSWTIKNTTNSKFDVSVVVFTGSTAAAESFGAKKVGDKKTVPGNGSVTMTYRVTESSDRIARLEDVTTGGIYVGKGMKLSVPCSV